MHALGGILAASATLARGVPDSTWARDKSGVKRT